MKTETENLRELDAWIAERVMGWTIYRTTDEWFDAGNPTGDKIQVLDQRPHFQLPHYTTNPAAAMQVLEKCSSENTVTIRKQSDGSFCVWWTESENMRERCVFGDTLPLAICKFAKQLFSK